MRTEIFLENQPLDLYDDIDSAFTYTVDDIKDFGKRNTNFSKTITIPGNQVNNQAFGFAFSVGSGNFYDPLLDNFGYNFNPMVSARVLIFIDRIQIFKGSLRILEIKNYDGEIEYECFVFGELGGVMFELANRRIEDLDFSSYNMVYNAANIQASWNTIAGAGVYMPLIDYGNVSTNKEDFQYSAFRPALYVKEYIQKIFQGTSYTLTMPELDTALFNRLVITHNKASLTVLGTDIMSDTAPEQLTLLGSGDTSNNIYFDYPTLDVGFNLDATNKIFTYKLTTGTIATFTISLNGQQKKGGSGGFLVSMLKNGSVVLASGYNMPGTGGTTPWSYNHSFNVPLVQGDTISINVDAGGPLSSGQFFDLYGGGTMIAISTTPIPLPARIGDILQINTLIPKGIFQKDFFMDVVKMINAYVYENPFNDRELFVKPYIDFYPTTAANALNWTNKIDRSQPVRIIPMSELNARFYQYKFKDDNDFFNEDYRKAYNQNYGDRLFDTTYEFSKDTEILEVLFANSVLYKNTGGDKVFPAIYKLSGNTEQPMDHVVRICQAKKITGVTAYNILDNSTVLASPTSYGYAGHVDDPDNPTNDICFGAPSELQFGFNGTYPTINLFNAYYSEYLAEITDKDSKIVVAMAKLTPLDIQQLDFSKFIYVDGVLFRLNKISDYNPINEGLCEIQLLKVIDY